MENIYPLCPEPEATAQCAIHLDLVMLAHNLGSERTEEEFESLAKRAGFSGSKVICGYASMRVLEFCK